MFFFFLDLIEVLQGGGGTTCCELVRRCFVKTLSNLGIQIECAVLGQSKLIFEDSAYPEKLFITTKKNNISTRFFYSDPLFFYPPIKYLLSKALFKPALILIDLFIL